MIHPDTEVRLISSPLGRGVVATAFIPRGTIIWVQDPLDGSWSLDEVMGWPEIYRPLIYRGCFMSQGRVVQPWDHACQVNHACDPNCGGHDLGFELALRDVWPGEQLTEDYDEFKLPDDPPFPCACGAAVCRGLGVYRTSPDTRERLAEQVLAALLEASLVVQPLAGLLDTWSIGLAIANASLALGGSHVIR